jgi:hypothetical protein
MTRWPANALTRPRPARRPRADHEHTEQVVFFNRVRTLAMNDKRYARAARRTHAIPNGGGRSKAEAGRLKAEGVTAGISDIFCALPVGPWHGLYVEMKSQTGTASSEQRAWLDESTELGYIAVCCRGADEAMTVWRAYVDGGLDAAPA